MSLFRHLLELALLFVRMGFAAFGGGIAVIPEIQHVAVTQRHWLTTQEFADSYALGQLTPGPGMLMVMAIGYKVAGVSGALVSMLAMFLPVGALAYVTGWRWDKVRHSPWRSAVQHGLTPVTVGLLLAGSFTLVRAAVVDIPAALIMTGATLLLLSRRINPAFIVLIGGVVGLLIYR